MLKAGDTLEDFTLKDDRGADVRWSSLRGKPVVIFAYPKADTPGCTREACAFRDLAGEFAAKGVTVYGISADSVDRQAKFREKYGLTIPLLSDPDKKVLTALGAWGEKKSYGKTFTGIIRSTYSFDKNGIADRVWPSVKVDGHADKVLAEVGSR
jgi:peroxiredoxin Q/BCP